MSLHDEIAALEQTVGWRVLADQSVLKVGGDDARTWLNGMVTCRLDTLEPGRGVYALFADVRGKILSDGWITSNVAVCPAAVVAVIPTDRASALGEHLNRYVIMEDVDLAVCEDVAVLTAQGPRAVELTSLAGAYGADRLAAGGLEWVVASERLRDVQAVLEEAATKLGGRQVSEGAWEVARVRAGIPRYGRDFDHRHYPQEVGLEGRAVSFDKGCYLGQEVIVRLQHRGRASRMCARLRVESDVELGPEAVIAQGDETVGYVTSSVCDPEAPGTMLALGLVKRAVARQGEEVRVGVHKAVIDRVLAS